MKVHWERFLWIPLVLSLALLIVPQLAFVQASFFIDTSFGQTADTASIDSYYRIFTERLYLEAFAKTVYLSVASTFISISLAFPTAYSLSRIGGWIASASISTIIAVSLVSVAIKLLGLSVMLGHSGIINQFLQLIGISPIQLLHNDIGVIIGLVQYTLPIAILLLFTVINTIPLYLEEAAHIHGASRTSTFLQILIPISVPGLIISSLISFNMCMGAFTSPLILGGGHVLTVPVLIQQKIIAEAQYSLASALSTALVAFVFVLNVIIGWSFRQQDRLSTRRKKWHAALVKEAL